MAELTLEELIQLAKSGEKESIQPLLFSTQEEVLTGLLENPAFSEQEALLLLNRIDLPPAVIKALAALRNLIANHDVRLAILRNPKTPPHTSLPLVKFLYPFELMGLCLLPVVPPEVKQAAEGLLVSQIPHLALGQKINLAKRGPASLVRHLLTGEDVQINQAVLNNPFLTEDILVQTLNRPRCPSSIILAILNHPKWSVRYSLRFALVRNPQITLAQALRFIPDLRQSDLREISRDPRANPEVRRYLQNHTRRHPAKQGI
jgi:hypothetical protein